MKLRFIIDRDDLSPERIEAYTKVLNILIGYNAKWKVENVVPSGSPNLLDCTKPEQDAEGGTM